jgi:hypothetical protein
LRADSIFRFIATFVLPIVAYINFSPKKVSSLGLEFKFSRI